MIRCLTMLLVVTALPAGPAIAVVAIDTPRAPPALVLAKAQPAERTQASPQEVPADLTPGELVAAVAGLAVLVLALSVGRQPHSVSA